MAQKNPFSEYQLFNLLSDPKETSPLLFPEKEKELQSKLSEHIQKSGKIPWQ
jgi:DTW domain-containing protein YfiP